MRYTACALLLFIAAVIPVSAQGDCRGGSESYRVYDAVLARMFAGNKVTFDTQSPIDQLIIRDRTTSEIAWGPGREHWPQVKIRLRDLSDELISDYESKLAKPIELTRCFEISLKYALLSGSEFNTIFSRPHGINQEREEWDKFYQKFPKSGGYVSLSNVGFDKSITQALVYMVHWCGELCGTGHYVKLSKSDGKWTVTAVGMMWIS